MSQQGSLELGPPVEIGVRDGYAGPGRDHDDGPHGWEADGPRGFEPPSEGFALIDLLTSFSRRRTGIVLWVAAVFASAVTYTLLAPKTYESHVVVLVEVQDPGPDARALEALGWFGGTGKLETEIGLIRSRRVLEPAVEKLGLHVTLRTDGISGTPLELGLPLEVGAEAQAGSYRLELQQERWVLSDPLSGSVVGQANAAAPLLLPGLAVSAPYTGGLAGVDVEIEPFGEVVEDVEERIEVSATSREGDLVGLRCEARSAAAAQALCRELSNGYIRLKTELQRVEASTTSAFLLDQAGLLRQRLRAAEDSLEAYGRRNDAVALDDRASAEIRQLTDLVGQREQIEAERAALADLIAQIETRVEGAGRYRDLASFPTFLQVDAVSQLLASLVELENQRSDLAVLRADGNPDLVALDIRIGELEDQLRRFAASYEAGLAAQVASLERALANADARVSGIPTRQVEMARLERETQLLADLYNLLETRRREAELAEAVDLPDVRIIDEASLPVKHASPSLPRNGALALLLGLAMGLTWALVREMSDASVYDRGNLERATGLPVLGTVPRVTGPRLLFDKRHPTGEPSSKAALRQEVARESFRGLVSDLRFIQHSMGREGLRTLVVTSAGPAEGKTFTACNLALAQAASGTTTVLVDVDLRSGDATRYMGCADQPGLREVLGGDLQLSEVLTEVQLDPTGEARSVGLVPAGKPGSEAAAFLHGPRFADIIDSLAQRFECIIIDTPPISLFSEAVALGALADGVVVVARSEVTDQSALSLTLERLRRTGANIVGVVLNDSEIPGRYESYATYYALPPVRNSAIG